MTKALKRTDLFWLAFTGLVALAPLVPAVATNSFFMHVLILVLLYALRFADLPLPDSLPRPAAVACRCALPGASSVAATTPSNWWRRV